MNRCKGRKNPEIFLNNLFRIPYNIFLVYWEDMVLRVVSE